MGNALSLRPYLPRAVGLEEETGCLEGGQEDLGEGLGLVVPLVKLLGVEEAQELVELPLEGLEEGEVS
jgi:hypothetical protein